MVRFLLLCWFCWWVRITCCSLGEMLLPFFGWCTPQFIYIFLAPSNQSCWRHLLYWRTVFGHVFFVLLCIDEWSLSALLDFVHCLTLDYTDSPFCFFGYFVSFLFTAGISGVCVCSFPVYNLLIHLPAAFCTEASFLIFSWNIAIFTIFFNILDYLC